MSCLNLGCRGIFETHNNPIQEREFYSEYFDVIDHIPKTFVGEPIGYFLPSKKFQIKKRNHVIDNIDTKIVIYIYIYILISKNMLPFLN